MNSAWGIIKINTHRIHILRPILPGTKHVICFLCNIETKTETTVEHIQSFVHHIDVDASERTNEQMERTSEKNKPGLKLSGVSANQMVWHRKTLSILRMVPWNHLIVSFTVLSNKIKWWLRSNLRKWGKTKSTKAHTYIDEIRKKNSTNGEI